MKDFKKLFKYIGLGFFIVGGISLLLTVAQVVSLLGSFNIFSEGASISSIINSITISIFCFILGLIFVDFFQ